VARHKRSRFIFPNARWTRVAYDRLYAFNGGVDDYSGQETPWQFIRLKPRLSEVEVYRKLPHASKFRVRGLRDHRVRIRFCRCEATGSLRAEIEEFARSTATPPATRIRGTFRRMSGRVSVSLNFRRHLRSVTVGVTKRIWVWDKTKATMATVRTMARWSEANMLTAIRRLEKKFPHAMAPSLRGTGFEESRSEYGRSEFGTGKTTGRKCCKINSVSRYACSLVMMEKNQR
jgi:hypothetical protein